MFLQFQWGHEEHNVKAADVDDRDCPRCERVRRFAIHVKYRYDYVYFVFGAVTKLEYFLVCQSCRSRFQIREEEARPYVGTLPIPVSHRFGCLFGLLFFGCAMACFLWAINR